MIAQLLQRLGVSKFGLMSNDCLLMIIYSYRPYNLKYRRLCIELRFFLREFITFSFHVRRCFDAVHTPNPV